MILGYILPQNLNIVCGGLTTNAKVKITNKLNEKQIFSGFEMQTLWDILSKKISLTETERKQYEVEANNMFTMLSSGCNKSQYLYNCPIYFEHKIPDAMSSFPTLIVYGEYAPAKLNNAESIPNNSLIKCKPENKTISPDDIYLITNGSTSQTCGAPFYKTSKEEHIINLEEKRRALEEKVKPFVNKIKQQLSIQVKGGSKKSLNRGLASLTVAQLRAKCKNKGMTGYSKMKKETLIKTLQTKNSKLKNQR